MTAAIEDANSGSGRGRRVPGPGCGERSVRPAAQCRGAVCWLESPHMAELRANIARLIGQLVTDQPAARRWRDARKACGSNSRSIRKDHNELSTTPPDRRRRDLPRRMTGCASLPEKTVPSRCNNSTRVRVRIPARVLPDPACRSSTSGSRRARRTSDRRPSAPGCGPATSPHRCSD
jgi:hypothetical protein